MCSVPTVRVFAGATGAQPKNVEQLAEPFISFPSEQDIHLPQVGFRMD